MAERERERIKALYVQVQNDNRGLADWQLANIMLRLYGITDEQITEATETLVLAKGHPLRALLE